MNYSATLSYLNSLQSTKIELGLERISSACAKMGHPEKKFPSIIVAGTNGKGSTCAFLESILRHHGMKVGLYTSPHLVDVRERIQVNREMISEEEFARVAGNFVCHSRMTRLRRVTYFEFLTAVAFQYFAEQKVDIAVLEVGLGGRFDATNIVTPLMSVITRISIDHQKYLGDTLEKIAFEKCGIIKESAPIVTFDQTPGAMNVIRRVAGEKRAELHVVNPLEIRCQLGLRGSHQFENAALAMRVAEIAASGQLASCFAGHWPLATDHCLAALSSTKWPGRLEIVSKKPLIILDGAHNPNGAEALARFIREAIIGVAPFLLSPPGSSGGRVRKLAQVSANTTRRTEKKTCYSRRKIIILFGAMADKDIEGMITPLAKVADKWVFTRPSFDRAADPQNIAKLVSKQANVIEPLSAAVARTVQTMSPNDALVITGSLYTVGEAKKYFTENQIAF